MDAGNEDDDDDGVGDDRRVGDVRGCVMMGEDDVNGGAGDGCDVLMKNREMKETGMS